MLMDCFAQASVLAIKAGKGPNAANNFAAAILAFRHGGWIVSLIGAAAMVGRLLIDEAATTHWVRSLKHILAAAIFSIIAFFVTFQWELSAINKAIIQGLTGALSPELVDWMTFTIQQKLGMNKPARRKPSRRKRSSGRKRSTPKKKPAATVLPAVRPRRRPRAT